MMMACCEMQSNINTFLYELTDWIRPIDNYII